MAAGGGGGGGGGGIGSGNTNPPESRVTEYGALEYARGLPPLSHNPGSWRKGAGCASATDAATGAATHTQRLEMGGTVSRTRDVRGAAQAVRGARAPLAGAAAGRRRSELRRVTSRRKTNLDGEQCLDFSVLALSKRILQPNSSHDTGHGTGAHWH